MKLKAKRSLFLYKKGYHRPPSIMKAIAVLLESYKHRVKGPQVTRLISFNPYLRW